MAQLGNDNRSKWDPKYCKELIEHMAAGCSFASFGGKALVKYSTLKRWEKMYPEFQEASEIGQLVCMYTWEKIIIGQANGSVKGLPATTIFALKNYFPDKFKENLSLSGAGNTIVVFDSGVPVKAIENQNGPYGNAVSNVVETKAIEIMPKRRDESSEEKKSQISQNLVKNPNLPDYLQNSITEDDI